MKDEKGTEGITINENYNDPPHLYIKNNRILKIITPDDKVWENPPQKLKFKCKNCGFTTVHPEKTKYMCPKCVGYTNEYWNNQPLWETGLVKH